MIDFLIVGGGIAGLSTGARLAPHGKVVVLEAESATAYHSTGRSAALFEAKYGLPSTLALNHASADFLWTHDGGFLSDRGLMLLGLDSDRDAFEHDKKVMELEEISVSDAKLRVPILNENVVKRAAFHAGAYDIDTHKLTECFAATIRANGGDVLVNQAFQSAGFDGKGWSIQTENAEFQARKLVNAAGAWADQVAAKAGITPLGLQPYRRSMARIPAPGGHDLSDWPMIFGAAESWYAKPDAGCLLVSPAEEDPVEPFDAWAEDMVLAEGLAKYEAAMTEPVTRMLANWAGLRTFAPDRSLVIGPEPANRAFIWVAGMGGYGIQSSPAYSQLAADLVTGQTPEIAADIVAQLTPERLRSGA